MVHSLTHKAQLSTLSLQHTLLGAWRAGQKAGSHSLGLGGA